MADFSVSGSQVDLNSEDDLVALLKEFIADGWRGMVTGPVWSLEVHIEDPTALNGTRTIKASIGDKKVVIGGVCSVMTQEAFTATYGG